MNFSTDVLKAGVPFVSVSAMRAIINKVGIDQCLISLCHKIEQDFARWHEFEKSARYASHSQDGVIELMPISDGEFFSMKYVNGHPINTKRNLQTVAAFGILSDVTSGYPVMISEMCLLTALRTAATSALASKYLAPEGAKKAALIGNGAQAEFQILALRYVLNITEFTLFDIDKSASEKTAKNLCGHPVSITICNTVEEALAGAQIITTCTADKRNATILKSDMVANGVHINAIGGDCPGKTELEDLLLQRADHVVVEFEPQTRIEGDIQQLSENFSVCELHTLINQETVVHRNKEELTIFDGVGFALEDFSALTYLHNLLITHNTHTATLELISQQSDPRNLFSLLGHGPSESNGGKDYISQYPDSVVEL